MSTKKKAFVGGVAGGAVALGAAELVHGLYQLVPSLPVAVAQRIIALTPGDVATESIGLLGKAATPILVTVVVISTLALCGLLAMVSRRSAALAVGGLAALGAVALISAFLEPFIAPLFTVLTVVGALALGAFVSGSLLYSPPSTPHPDGPQGQRHREAGAQTEIGRRNFLLLGGGAVAAGALAAGAGRLLGGGASVGSAESSGGGATSAAGTASVEVKRLPPPPDAASIEVEGMPRLITPADDFYLIDTAISSPRIDRDSWTVSIKGAVENPLELSFSDLTSLPAREADITMSCVSNEVGGGLVSNGRWTGVLLSDVLREAGVSPERIGARSEQLVGRSVDGWTSGFKTELAFDGREALLAFALNDEDLPVKHGYPVRLVVPGLYGYVSATKWLAELELTNWDFDAYWIQRNWAKEGPIKTQSRIDTLSGGQTISPGKTPVGGVAWAPHRGIERVEVSTDGGQSWNDARLAEQLDRDTWRQYVYEWEAEPGEHTVQVRATDGEGQTQTRQKNPPIPSGATGYHTINVTVEG